MSQQDKSQFKQLQIDYCKSLAFKIVEKLLIINKKMIDIGQKNLTEIDDIEKYVEQIKNQIFYFINLYLRCHEDNTDKKSNFLFNEEDYSYFKFFLEKTQDIIGDIDLIFKQAREERREKLVSNVKAVPWQTYGVRPDVLNKKAEPSARREEIQQLEDIETRIQNMNKETEELIKQMRKSGILVDSTSPP